MRLRTAPPTVMSDFTVLLERASQGDGAANEEVARRLYEELRSLARREMGKERVGHTLQPTALVHDAWLRLVSNSHATFENRAHFFASAAHAIRRVLVDHARKRGRRKRGGDAERVKLDESFVAQPDRDDRVLALDEALERLAGMDPFKARIVELRFFAGMTLDEVAEMLEVSQSTIVREWRLIRAWLQSELDDEPSDAT